MDFALANWEDKEKIGELNANPPFSPEDFGECTIIKKPTIKAPAQPPKVAEEAQIHAFEP